MELVRVGQQRDSDGERPEDGLNSKAGGIHTPGSGNVERRKPHELLGAVHNFT